MRVPLGVLAMIYESRPNVTIDAAALAVKSATPSSCAAAMRRFAATRSSGSLSAGPLAEKGLPARAVQLIESSDRALVGELIRARDYVDVLIPRGGKSLVAVSRPKRPFR